MGLGFSHFNGFSSSRLVSHLLVQHSLVPEPQTRPYWWFREYQLKRGASYALLIYYATHFAFQLFLGDGGDSFTNPGIASVVFGLSGNAADKCSAFLLGMITALIIVLLQVVCFEPKLLWMEDIAPLVQLDQPEPDGGISGNAGAGGARREYVGRLGTSAGLFDDDIVGA